jgi:hypothetical protein
MYLPQGQDEQCHAAISHTGQVQQTGGTLSQPSCTSVPDTSLVWLSVSGSDHTHMRKHLLREEDPDGRRASHEDRTGADTGKEGPIVVQVGNHLFYTHEQWYMPTYS